MTSGLKTDWVTWGIWQHFSTYSP